nr:MAG TPA: hypothetical protein [Caudoviricetes sp.]
MRLCGLRCAAAYLYLSGHRAHKHAHQLTRGRADARRSADTGRRTQDARQAQGGKRRADADGGRRLHRAPMCAGAGGADDIGRDGTSSDRRGRLTAADALRRAGRCRAYHIDRICGDYDADYDARAV